MNRVRLLTSNGDLVHEDDLPPFLTTPNAIVWGDRVFALAEFAPFPQPQPYREVFAHWLPSTTGSAPRGSEGSP